MLDESWKLRRFGLALAATGWLSLQLFAGSGLFALEASEPQQFFRESALISLEDPALAIGVASAFTFVGRHPFTIREVAAGERFVFVDAEGDLIKRLFVVQFEGFLPGVDSLFRYDLSKSPVVAGYPFRSNGYAYDVNEAIADNPKGEAALTHAFLEAKGYRAAGQWMMWRSLTIADEARRKEIILFYLEDLGSTGLALANLYENGGATPAWNEIQRGLEVRANGVFRLTGLNKRGEPIASGWSSIPNRLEQ